MVLNFNYPLSENGNFLRETALNEAVTDNANEITRWQRYKQENETAIENMDRFAKHLRVEVMVPIGRKAMMPGELIHTNEVLVSHFQGYFSKCSSHKAKEICQLRLKLADEQLKKLDQETDFLQNKLHMPYLDGALPTAEQRDIIEELSEAEHDEWMARHKIMLRKWKQEEKAERERTSANSETVEEEALLAELGDDLQKLNITEVNEEVLAKLLKGENKTSNSFTETQTANSVNDQNDKNVFEMLEHRAKVEEENQELETLKVDNRANDIVMKMMADQTAEPSKKVRVEHGAKAKEKPNVFSPTNLAMGNEKPPVESVKEVELIRGEAKFLPLEDQIVFYEFQIKIIKEKSKNLEKSIPYYNEEKLKLLNIIVSLTEDLEGLLDQIDLNELSETEDPALDELTAHVVDVTPDTIESNKEKKNKRRISFALCEKTLEFRRNETVAQMLPKSIEPKQAKKRDVSKFKNTTDTLFENTNYLKDQKIVNNDEQRDKTLKIVFKHSPHKPRINFRSRETTKVDDINTPADFYPLFLAAKTQSQSQESNNAHEPEYDVKLPMLSEDKRKEASEDKRVLFDGFKAEGAATGMPKKSILRNKSAVESELRNSNNYQKSKTNKTQSRRSRPSEKEANEMSTYHNVMNEVTEKVLNAPDPLPVGKYIDAHMPKKRVSRFKQQRAGNKES